MSLSFDPSAIIRTNTYINERYNTCDSQHSFCSLVRRKLSQGQNIVLGKCMEPFFHDLITKTAVVGGWVPLIIETEIDGKKIQKDHLYIHEASKLIIYAEQKNNLSLDSEKAPATRKKIRAVETYLKAAYPAYTVRCGLFASRYLTMDTTLAKEGSKKFADITVWGVNEFLKLFNIGGFADEAAYKAAVEAICDAKFGAAT